jgi:heme o synthase
VINRVLQNILLFADLIKYKLSLAVTFSAATGYFICRNDFNKSFFFLITGIFLLAAGSSALNQYSEREQDIRMKRTRNRPIPSKKIKGSSVIMIFLLLLIPGSILLFSTGILAFTFGIINIILYNFLYTSLKKKTALAIIPGALVGAITPLIGYASAGGNTLNHNIIIFSTFMFLWQLPHFWLILIKYGEEYRNAGFVTILKYMNETEIRYLVFFWVLGTSGFLLLTGFEAFGSKRIIQLIPLNIAFILLFYRFLFVEKKDRDIRGAFILINSFSFLIMLFLILVSFQK